MTDVIDDPYLVGAKPRVALACGAIGAYDRDRVIKCGAAFHPDMKVVHEADRAIVMMDREPERWQGPDGVEGFAWPSTLRPPVTPTSWEDVARDWNAVGLRFDREGPMLHSSISGVSPLYIQAEPGVIYWAVRVDPLAQATPAKLTVDWDAWGSLFTLNFPIAGRTPFEEIKCVAPWTTVRLGADGAPKVESPTWPWSEIEPNLSAADGAPAIHEALQETYNRLHDLKLTVPISAGRDSRMLLAYAAQIPHAAIDAVTVYEDNGTDRVLKMAADVCQTLGLDHRVQWNTEEQFWEDEHRRNLSCDYQQVVQPWLVPPILRALETSDGLVIDGIAGNVMFEPTARNVVPAVYYEPGERWATLMWRRMRTPIRSVFRGGVARALGQRSLDEFIEIGRDWSDHPSRAAMQFYVTRTIRCIGLRPTASLGSVADVVSPLIEDPVANAIFSVNQQYKFDHELYREVFKLVDPRMVDLAFSSRGAADLHEDLPRRRTSELVMNGYRERLSNGPLAPYLSGAIRNWLASDERLPKPARGIWAAMEGVTTFHLWYERYADKLNDLKVAEALEVVDRSEDLASVS